MNFGWEMKSLLVLLFLGAAVATLAEEPFEDEAVAELLDEEDDETIAELAIPVVVPVQAALRGL